MLTSGEVMQLIGSLIWLLAGVGVFIVGMNFMGDALEKSAGAGMKSLLSKVEALLEAFFDTVQIASEGELSEAFKLYDMLLTQRSVLSAMLCSADVLGSHGSALVDKQPPDPLAPLRATRTVTLGHLSEMKPVSPMPDPELWFETLLARKRQEVKL